MYRLLKVNISRHANILFSGWLTFCLGDQTSEVVLGMIFSFLPEGNRTQLLVYEVSVLDSLAKAT